MAPVWIFASTETVSQLKSLQAVKAMLIALPINIAMLEYAKMSIFLNALMYPAQLAICALAALVLATHTGSASHLAIAQQAQYA